MKARASFLAASFIALGLLSVSVVAQKTIQVAPFNSVELRNGGKAIVRQGPGQRVTLVKGSTDCTQVTVDRNRLIIDSGKSHCPRDREREVEIVTPTVEGLAVTHGGLLQSLGTFSGQTAIAVAVNQGGTIDIRSMRVQSVTAAVTSGGRIFVIPQNSMIASVVDGGLITYWGAPQVTSSISNAAGVIKGAAEDADKPISDLTFSSPPITSVAPIAPIPPVRSPRK